MNKSRIILPSTAEGDRRSSEGRIDLVINHNDDKDKTIKKITIINKQKEENVIKVSTCQYSSSCVRVKEQI